MRLLFKQRFFSWFDSYDIYNEAGETVYTVEGNLSWGHCLHILDAAGNHIGTVKERVLTFLPKFELYEHDQYIGCIQTDSIDVKLRYPETNHIKQVILHIRILLIQLNQ